MDPDPYPLSILFVGYDSWFYIQIAVLLLLLFCSALISGAEVAFFSLRSVDIASLEEENTSIGKTILKLLAQPKKLLATILVANNFINIAIVLLFASLGELLFSGIAISWLRIVVEIGVVTFLILLFGEILPKIYANRNSVLFSSFMAYPLHITSILLTPVSNPMQAFTNWINNKFGRQRSNLSVDQLSQALELTSKGDTTKEEQKMLEGIVTFGSTEARQVMCPRIDMFALEDVTPFKEVLEQIKQRGYSRIPVYQDSADSIIGVLHVKDLLPHLEKSTFDWSALKSEPFFVPENKKLDDLLLEFKEQKKHVAIVVDEYGGTSGLVTLEDIIEEIVGDISDEFDDEDLVYSKLDDFNFIFEGKTALRDFYKVIRLEDDSVFEDQKGEAESLAGLVLEIAGSFPKIGDKVLFDAYMFQVEAMDKRRIKQIKVTLPNEE
ncbi:MAG: gliding motility-associated protein GldE [Flavobacteriaceae bacterium]|nr:gliding motility-associated protein GldE [Flavobacteriaceae bacterium]